MTTVPNTSPITTSEDSQNDSDTVLSIDNTEDEMHMDLSSWTLAERDYNIWLNSMRNISEYSVKRLLSVPL